MLQIFGEKRHYHIIFRIDNNKFTTKSAATDKFRTVTQPENQYPKESQTVPSVPESRQIFCFPLDFTSFNQSVFGFKRTLQIFSIISQIKLKADMQDPDAFDLGGFEFSASSHNAKKGGFTSKLATKTGTTISGVIYADGVVLGADTRSTNGETVADKNCEKIHYIAPNIYCCGAGTAADTEAVTGMVSSALFLHRKSTLRESRVVSAQSILKSHLFKYQGHVGAALVLGGFDIHGPQLFTVYPHGSSDCLPYATMGSGSLAAMSIFESDYKDGMSEDEAKLLVARSIRAGIFNDLGSGSNIDLCVLSRAGTKYLRNFEIPQERTYIRAEGYKFKTGTTVINKRNFQTATSTTTEPKKIL
ncbi:unnamed protein product [Bathycoccus prasinos]